MSDEKKAMIREALIGEFQALSSQNEKEVQRRVGYEELIRRPYFHTKPLGKRTIILLLSQTIDNFHALNTAWEIMV